MKELNEQVIAKEYRLIPLEVSAEENDWNIRELIIEFWDYRKLALIIFGVVGFIGLVVALVKPDGYETSTTLLIESQSQSVAENLLSNYGGLLGLSGGAFEQTGQISSELYPDILSSLPFQLELIEQELNFANYDTTVSIYTFFTKIYRPSFFHYFKKYTVGLNSLEAQMFREKNPELDYSWEERDVLNLPSAQLAVARGMSEVMEMTVENNKVTINGWFPDPVAASELVNEVKQLLSEYIIEHQTEKAMNDLQFIKKQYNNAKEQFNTAQEKLAQFRDKNQNLVTAKAQIQEQRLQSDYDLAYSIYNSLAQQYEQAQIKVQEETPVFSTLQPVIVPSSASYPNRVLIVILSLFIGGFMSVLVIGAVITFKNVYEDLELDDIVTAKLNF